MGQAPDRLALTMATLARSDVGIACKACERPLYPIGGTLPVGCVYCGAALADGETIPVVPEWQHSPAEASPVGDDQAAAPLPAPGTVNGGIPSGYAAQPDRAGVRSSSLTATVPPATVVRKRRQSGIAILAGGVVLVAGLIGWDRLGSASQRSGISFHLDSEWQAVTLPPGASRLAADGPFRLRVNGDLYVVPEGIGVAVPSSGLDRHLEARAAERPVSVDIFY